MNLTPTKDCLIVRPSIEKHELFTLLRQKRTGDGVVVAIGPDVEDIKLGDTVLFGDNIGQDFEWENEGLLVMRESHVLGVYEQ